MGGAVSARVGMNSASTSAASRLDAGDEVGALAEQADVVDRGHLPSALDADAHARVIVSAAPRQELLMPGDRPRQRREAAFGVDGSILAERLERELDDAGAGAGERARPRARKPPRQRLEFVQHHGLGNAEAERRRPHRAGTTAGSPAMHRVGEGAAGDADANRADGIERGGERHGAVARNRYCVGFNPTRPQSAAGMRTEPPVSVPIATAAMPSATEIGAPGRGAAGDVRAVQGLPGVP